jgi:hypothetical protein
MMWVFGWPLGTEFFNVLLFTLRLGRNSKVMCEKLYCFRPVIGLPSPSVLVCSFVFLAYHQPITGVIQLTAFI